MTAGGLDDVDDSAFVDPPGATGGPPPPPPPPPPPTPGASGVFKMGPQGALGLPDVLARLERFAAVLVGLEREVTDLHAVASRLPTDGSAAAMPAPGGVGGDPAEAERLKADLKRARDETERLEGELQSLRLFREQTRTQIQKAVSGIVDMKLPPEAEKAVKAIVVDRDRLQEEKQRIEQELQRIRGEATKRFSALKNDLDRVQKEHDTVRVQKDNLMRQLQARDEEAAGKREVTLEDITSSEIFRTMLGNIKKTSRQELTVLHDAIASVRAIDPKAYETVLEIVARAFKKQGIENPLATLPRD